MNLLLPCSAILCAALSGPVMADNALPAAPSPCLTKPDATHTSSQQRQPSRSNWRRQCYLADAERSDRQREIEEEKLSSEQILQLLDDIQAVNHAPGDESSAPLDAWLRHPHGDSAGLAWHRAGGPGSVFSDALPLYQQTTYHTPWLPLGDTGMAQPMPAVPEPPSYSLMLAGMALLGTVLYRQRRGASGGKAPPEVRQ